jgi:hypothetical protein
MTTVNSARSQARVRRFTEQLNNRTREVLARSAISKIGPALTSIEANARVRYYTEQLNNRTREVYARAAIPKIDPALISIEAQASRLIDMAEDVLSSIINAPSNDGREVAILTPCGGIPGNPLWWREDRVEIDGAFNILIGDSQHSLIRNAEAWYRKNLKRCLNIHDIFLFNGTYPIEPPIEIRLVTRALARVRAWRRPLEVMLEQSQQRSAEHSTMN